MTHSTKANDVRTGKVWYVRAGDGSWNEARKYQRETIRLWIDGTLPKLPTLSKAHKDQIFTLPSGQDKNLGQVGEAVIRINNKQVYYIGVSGTYPVAVKSSGESHAGSGLDMDAVHQLYDVYETGYAFPRWVLKASPSFSSKYTGSVVVYYDSGCTLSDARQAALFREPVNIEMKRSYSQKVMEKHFGWQHGRYGKYLDQRQTLAPNIAIYCRTPVLYKNKYVDAHVINAIGYAFDHVAQPDYLYFIKGNRQNELQGLYEKVFHKIFACARQNDLSKVAMSLVGGGFFASKYVDPNRKSKWGNQVNFLRDVWVPAFRNVLTSYRDVQVRFMGGDAHMMEVIGMAEYGGTLMGNFPDLTKGMKQHELGRTLFVNAWDPWSIVGNGNEGDNSLDGHMGSATMMGVLCWPGTNRDIRYTQVSST